MLNAPHRNYRLEAFLCKRECVGEKAWGARLKQKTGVKSENKKFKQVGLQWKPSRRRKNQYSMPSNANLLASRFEFQCGREFELLLLFLCNFFVSGVLSSSYEM